MVTNEDGDSTARAIVKVAAVALVAMVACWVFVPAEEEPTVADSGLVTMATIGDGRASWADDDVGFPIPERLIFETDTSDVAWTLCWTESEARAWSEATDLALRRGGREGCTWEVVKRP